jgi:hypothetical protein
MSLATDILKKHVKPPRHATRVQGPEVYAYAKGYAWRRGAGRHSGCNGTLTWLIALAQIQTMIREGVTELVWPWVDNSPEMRTRQVARIHARARREGWVITTRQLVSGLRITYKGERAKAHHRRTKR